MDTAKLGKDYCDGREAQKDISLQERFKLLIAKKCQWSLLVANATGGIILNKDNIRSRKKNHLFPYRPTRCHVQVNYFPIPYAPVYTSKRSNIQLDNHFGIVALFVLGVLFHPPHPQPPPALAAGVGVGVA